MQESETIELVEQSPTNLGAGVAPDLDAAYREMAQDTVREAEALEWAEGTLLGIEDESKDENLIEWQ